MPLPSPTELATPEWMCFPTSDERAIYLLSELGMQQPDGPGSYLLAMRCDDMPSLVSAAVIRPEQGDDLDVVLSIAALQVIADYVQARLGMLSGTYVPTVGHA